MQSNRTTKNLKKINLQFKSFKLFRTLSIQKKNEEEQLIRTGRNKNLKKGNKI